MAVRGGEVGFGPCNQSTIGHGLFVSEFSCRNTDAEVAFIRVFAE